MRRLLIVLLALGPAAACAPYLYPAGPPERAPAIERAEADAGNAALVMADGVRLPLRAWPPEGPPRAVILALHGLNDYSKAFEEPAADWAEAGFLTYAYDQRGFGRAPHRGRWAGVATYVDDLRAAARLIRDRHPDLPLVLLGESMGGAIVMTAAAGDDPPDADRLVLVAPAVWGREVMPWWQRAALDFFAHTLPWLEVSGQNLGKQPSDNIAMLRALGRDPLVLKQNRIDAIWGLVNLMDAARAAAPRLDGPALILYGDREDLIPPEAWRSLLAALPEDGCLAVRVYDSGYHMLLRDLDADRVIADVAAYAAAAQPPCTGAPASVLAGERYQTP